jgi:acyl dehydratase
MVSDWFGLENVRTFRVRFRARVWPGDTVTASGEVTDVTHEDDGATVEADIAVENDDGDTLITGSAVAELPSKG